ncbi:hypothetical protein HETIRDRAFT_416134 [Heterobasidion irregulare TC 32-1]|uniref:Uncharacterized protein n=1 Tax=Heterobasidion irregulare (strain TC 32-1) TaxID=747525 RepID=W4KF23_HETIT|nr:uncharacterized protein HETIRDRAFT_416134 [Heterobasidion irregulare TC 32-1]ETW84443.1 hypothetical protein HETIRDRAFT_416134 [Heterobasidion irregulare TC 32-1]
MGQRHQVFVVAQVIPKGTPADSHSQGYQCIVALHHQWCYGRLPLLATRRFLTLLRVPENAEIVRWELNEIRANWESLDDNENLCPYIASLLVSCWSASLEPHKTYATGTSCHLLSPFMGSGDGDNNDGITIIDITDCQSPAYCFVSVGSMESRVRVPSWRPLTAERYCRAYYPRPDPEILDQDDEARRLEENVVSIIASLDNETVLDYSVLVDTWPTEYRKKVLSASPAHEAPTLIPSLIEMSIEPSIASVIQGGDTSSMRSVMAQPDKCPIVRSKLKELSPFPDEAIPLLLDLLRLELELNPKLLDLTSLSLHTAQILRLLTSFESIEDLNLSHNYLVDIETVEQILSKPLRRIVLLGCSSFDDEDVASLLFEKPELFQSLDAFIHPYFFSPHPDAPNVFAIASMNMGRTPYWVSVPYISPSRVVQTLIDIITALLEDNLILRHSFAVAAGISGWRGDEESWDKRSVVTVPSVRHCPKEGWAFFISVDKLASTIFNSGWAFVDLSESATASSNPDVSSIVEEDSQPVESTQESKSAPSSSAYTVYGLREFLKRFSIGRVPAPEDNIQRLEQLMIDADEVFKTQQAEALRPTLPPPMFDIQQALFQQLQGVFEQAHKDGIFKQMTSENVAGFIRKDDPRVSLL